MASSISAANHAYDAGLLSCHEIFAATALSATSRSRPSRCETRNVRAPARREGNFTVVPRVNRICRSDLPIRPVAMDGLERPPC